MRNNAEGIFPPCAKQTFLQGNLKLKAYYSLLREPPQLKQSINASYELKYFPSGNMAWVLPWKHWSQGGISGKETLLLNKVKKMEKFRVWTHLRPCVCKTSNCMHKHLVVQANMGLTCTARHNEVILQSVCTLQPLKICPQTSFRFQSTSVLKSKQLLYLLLSWNASSAEMMQNHFLSFPFYLAGFGEA